jgi:hypothetical protein
MGLKNSKQEDKKQQEPENNRFKISVQLPEEVLRVTVDNTFSVLKLKHKIEAEKKVLVRLQELYFLDNLLSNDALLTELGIANDAIVVVKILDGSNIPFNLDVVVGFPPNHRIVSITAMPTDTMSIVKTKIFEADASLTVESQVLMVCGDYNLHKPMKEGPTLAEMKADQRSDSIRCGIKQSK